MLGIRRILCPTDFSEPSRRALAHAVALAKWATADVTVLHVTSGAPVAGVRDELTDFATSAEAARVRVVTELREGDPVDRILELVDGGRADAVVMGTHGARGFERLVLGSVTEKVLRKSARPVMTIPRGEPESGAGDFLFRSVLCAVDFSDVSADAVAAACDVARSTGAKLLLVTIVDPEAGPDFLRSASDRLDALVPANAPPLRALVRAGIPAAEILRAAGEAEAGLLVLGVQVRGAVDLMLFGSTTQLVIRDARCPVLTVRGPRTEAAPARAGFAVPTCAPSPV
jgi:nucleotide-binding universal stress UspA family protein